MDLENLTKSMVPGWGADRRQEDRPGVPMETTPRPAPHAHWTAPQPATVEVLTYAPFHQLTPVFGSAYPPKGLSGIMRRYAYGIPDHFNSHWILLMLADQVDVIESGIVELVKTRPIALATGTLGLVLGAIRLRSVRKQRAKLVSRALRFAF